MSKKVETKPTDYAALAEAVVEARAALREIREQRKAHIAKAAEVFDDLNRKRIADLEQTIDEYTPILRNALADKIGENKPGSIRVGAYRLFAERKYDIDVTADHSVKEIADIYIGEAKIPGYLRLNAGLNRKNIEACIASQKDKAGYDGYLAELREDNISVAPGIRFIVAESDLAQIRRGGRA